MNVSNILARTFPTFWHEHFFKSYSKNIAELSFSIVSMCSYINHANKFCLQPVLSNFIIIRSYNAVNLSTDKRNPVEFIWCYLSEAFDAIHIFTALQQNLEYYAIRGPAVALLMSYMRGREQIVRWNKQDLTRKSRSATRVNRYLGPPFCFITYGNDLACHLHSMSSIMSVCI